MAYFYKKLSKIVPRDIRNKFITYLRYTGISVDYESFIGAIIFFSLLLGIISGFFFGFLTGNSFWIYFVLVFVGLPILTSIWIIFMIDKKARHVEENLPDALQLMASNLRAGMTPEKALLLSARPEFGPLKDEIDYVGKKVALGTGIGRALLEMAKRIHSKRLLRAVELIDSGLESGGSLAVLLEATSRDLHEQFLVDKKIKASITMYVIFIFSAAALISPILFGLSTFLVEILRSTFSQIDLSSASSAASALPISSVSINISEAFLIQFIIVFLLVNTLMASMLLGLIGKGKQREGLKYFLPMAALAIPLFFLSRFLISLVVSGLFQF